MSGQPLGYVSLASQKNHTSLYVRFRRLDDLPLDVIGREVARQGVAEFVAKVRAAQA
ncbi:hypothetical protein LZG04_34470 [Saccharothrix sp. S26]|uniref:hypothetical protein n=1 Tax=Saccharothrix sp. S26 TaxID=2907215 RepID=UPI001F36FC88|nr:hypothetical protein [Saccharothrix sp. S26]MCE6999882.1 hypothetical protein [Saccharothrix sp. S26]